MIRGLDIVHEDILYLGKPLMGNSLSSDDFKCIGGETWYKVFHWNWMRDYIVGTLLQELSCHSNSETLWR